MPDLRKIQFSKEKNEEFVRELKHRVNQYFRNKNISTKANTAMVIKTIAMVSFFLIPYGILVSGRVESLYFHYLLWVCIGLGVGGIGMSVMHDANHGAYSKHKAINRIIGRFIDLVGGNAPNWKIQHNVLHHTYTNIYGLDTDLGAGSVLRLSPQQKRRKIHKYQFIYAWFLYSFMTLVWMTIKDYAQMIEFKKKNLTSNNHNRSFWLEYTLMIVIKGFYYSYMVLIPILILPFAWWQVLLGVVLMQLTTGFVLATTFQLAHIMPETTLDLPKEKEFLEENWIVHQLKTTTNFAKKNWLISWYIGGLNFQIEHHLFPNICHIHYKKISKIVEETSKEYNITYNNIPTLFGALYHHAVVLRRLGRV